MRLQYHQGYNLLFRAACYIYVRARGENFSWLRMLCGSFTAALECVPNLRGLEKVIIFAIFLLTRPPLGYRKGYSGFLPFTYFHSMGKGVMVLNSAHKIITALFLAVFVLSIPANLCGLEVLGEFYTVKVDSVLSESIASQRHQELESEGFLPVFYCQQGSKYSIFFGKFEYYLDAYIYQELLRQRLIPTAIVESLLNSQGIREFSLPSSPLLPVFSPPESNLSEAPDYTLDFGDSTMQPLVPLIEKGEEEGYIPKDAAAAKPHLENLVVKLPDTDPRKGWAMTRLGVMALVDQDFDLARSHFFCVVNGEVVARPLDRIKAMRRVAWTYHHQGDRITAYRAYREMERFTGSDLVRAIARVECAGILLEMAREENVGSLHESRRECKKVLETAPERFREQRGCAASMLFETYYFQENYAKCTELAEQFLLEYPDVKRDRSSVLLMAGVAYARMGCYDDTIRLLKEQVAMQLGGPEDRFYHFDLQNYGIRWLAWCYKAKGDTENAAYWEARIQPLL
jgi:hypothetical protein